MKKKKPTQYVLDTYMRKQAQLTWIKHEPSYKHMDVKTNQTSYACRNRNVIATQYADRKY